LFFTSDKQSNQTNNIQSGIEKKIIESSFVRFRLILGTVIDTDIISPNGFDFDFNFHAAIQGTSWPRSGTIFPTSKLSNRISKQGRNASSFA